MCQSEASDFVSYNQARYTVNVAKEKNQQQRKNVSVTVAILT